MLVFLLYNLQKGVKILSMCLLIVVLLFKSGSTSKILSYALQCWKISLQKLFMWNFSGVTSSGPFLCFSLHLFFTFMSTSLSSSCWRLLAPVCTITLSTNTLIIALMSDCNFQHFYLCFLCSAFIFIGQFSLLIIHFCKMSPEFVTGKQKWPNHILHCLCRNWVTDAQWPTTNRLGKQGCGCFLITMRIFYLGGDVWQRSWYIV